MIPGIFTDYDHEVIARDTMKEILLESDKPLPVFVTPLEIQHDMVQNKRFMIDHGPTDPIHPKVHSPTASRHVRLSQEIVSEEWLVS